jgi:hypothetical protein
MRTWLIVVASLGLFAGCGGNSNNANNTITISGLLLDPDTLTPAVGAYVYIKDVYPRLTSDVVGADGMYHIKNVPQNLGAVYLVAEDADPFSGTSWYPTIDGHAIPVTTHDLNGLFTHVCPNNVFLPHIERVLGLPAGTLPHVGWEFGPVFTGTPPNVTPIADISVGYKNMQGMDLSNNVAYPSFVYNKTHMPGTMNSAIELFPTNECEILYQPGCTETCVDMNKPETCTVTGQLQGRTTTNEGGVWAVINVDGTLAGMNIANFTYTGTAGPYNFEKDIKTPLLPGYATFLVTLSQ